MGKLLKYTDWGDTWQLKEECKQLWWGGLANKHWIRRRVNSKTRVGVECENPIQPSKEFSSYNLKKTYSLL